ncbi:hypothetical protein CTAYLR_008485 [Chrysophaeum taylorii]|uniref:Pirin n=1 Tax=Chrysophaeum taylorii TaxID=2483200 RepID=A0AAD7XM71_9STRA|nr:hypothetical protein CTAYLR_008485 [Chrysophaeum taylorii]
MECRPKSVKEVFPAQRPHWVGDGFHVFPVFGRKAFTNEISPLLMFDYAPPKKFPATKAQLGVGQHPHRGQETVTLALQGEIEHADSAGHRDVIGRGDVQWMTAARGVIHEEFHSRSFAARGGVMEMCQLWVNLPKASKMSPPRYQPILDSQIPRVEFDGGYVRVIAGSHNQVEGPAMTYSPVDLFHVVVVGDREVKVRLDSPEKHNALLFVARGTLTVGDNTIGESQVALMRRDGNAIEFACSPKAQIILMGGLPLDEPIAARGPFVMNTKDELIQANDDFYAGRF